MGNNDDNQMEMEYSNSYYSNAESSVTLRDVKKNNRSDMIYTDSQSLSEINVKGGLVYAFFKRVFDFFAALIAIIVLSPLLIILALLVKMTSKGPVLYISRRVGKNGKEFNFFKFRSMKVNADQELEKLMAENHTGGITFKMKDDPRITKFGKFIRKTSLDELPQLFNILFGSMTIIGPRPALPSEAFGRLLEMFTAPFSHFLTIKENNARFDRNLFLAKNTQNHLKNTTCVTSVDYWQANMGHVVYRANNTNCFFSIFDLNRATC